MPPADKILSITVTETGDNYVQRVNAGSHKLTTDIPESKGGSDAGLAPYELLLSSLGTCTSATVRMYAKRKEWALDKITLSLSHRKEKGEDDVEKDVIICDMRLDGDLDAEQRARLVDIAGKCPIHKTLSGSVEIITDLAG